jgi:(p)ppGpp synthase/HD superfamily hydrolase
MNDHNRVSRAQEYLRKNDPVIVTTITGVTRPHAMHIQEVADLVWISGGSEDETIAAWCHDLVEDTDVTLDDIEEQFGKNVRTIVDGLTDHGHFKDMLLPERKRRQAERLRTESDSVRRIKIADQISNVKFLATDPIDSMTPEECYHYIRGAKLLADECKGVSTLLDDLFDQMYQKGIERYPEK